MRVQSTPSQRRTQPETATDRLLRAYRQRGDVRARDRVMQIYCPLVDMFARRYESPDATYDELMRAGSIGLLCAIQSYVPRRGEDFIGFAVPMISEEIKAHVRQRVPIATTPSAGSRADLKTAGLSHGVPDFELHDERLQLASAFRTLHPAEQRILQLRFVDELGSVEVARRLDVSSDRVARLSHGALTKLRRKLERLASGDPPAGLPVSDGDAAETPLEGPPEAAKETHSGRLLLRMPRALHTELASAARRDNVSLNQFITHALAGALGPQAGEEGGPEKPAPAPRWLAAAIVTNIVLLAIAGILALILLFVAWQGA